MVIPLHGHRLPLVGKSVYVFDETVEDKLLSSRVSAGNDQYQRSGPRQRQINTHLNRAISRCRVSKVVLHSILSFGSPGAKYNQYGNPLFSFLLRGQRALMSPDPPPNP